MKNNLLKLLAVMVLFSVVLTACSTAPASTAGNNVYPPAINVSGQSDIFLTPDIAYVYVGVHTESENVADALNENNTQSQAISDTLEELGIAKEDIQTSASISTPSRIMAPLALHRTQEKRSPRNTPWTTRSSSPCANSASWERSSTA